MPAWLLAFAGSKDAYCTAPSMQLFAVSVCYIWWLSCILASVQLQFSLHPVLSPFYVCGVVNPFHAGHIIAQSQALGKWYLATHASCVRVPYLFPIALHVQCITSECIQGIISQPCMWTVCMVTMHGMCSVTGASAHLSLAAAGTCFRYAYRK